MKVLVLGATGIIGEHICRTSLAAGHIVSGVSRERRLGPMPLDGMEHLRGDVRDIEAMRSLLGGRKFDVAVDLLSFSADQISATLELLEGRCTQYIFVSSATIYGPPALLARLSEASSLRDSGWEYPLRKIACESALRRIAASTGQAYTIVRPYITYSEQRLSFGCWEGSQALARMRAGLPVAIGDEIAIAPTALTHSNDVARATVSLFGNSRAMNEDFNVASDETVTWLDVYAIAADLLDVKLEIVQTPVSEIIDDFPELRGKASDRAMGRSFNLEKLRSACPGFEFRFSTRAGYAEVLSGSLTLNAPSPRWRGQMDRLMSHLDAPGRVPYVRTDTDLQQLPQRLRYALGRSRVLSSTYRMVAKQGARQNSYATR